MDENKRQALISPSIYAASFLDLRAELGTLEEVGADSVHVDIMDGHFVPRMAFGADHVCALSSGTDLPLDVHLMALEPEQMIDDIVKAGAHTLTIHCEATTRLLWCLQRIRKLGVRAGVALNPETPICAVESVLDYVDQVLVMTVNPGQAGESFIPQTLAKVRDLAMIREDRDFLIEVDGSIDDGTGRLARQAGADIFVSGGYLMKDVIHRLPILRSALRLESGNE